MADEQKFVIPEIVKKQYPDLIPLILESESMTDNEREYWFSLLPIMTLDQVNRLRGILQNEKKQLSDLEKKYKDTISDMKNADLTKRSLYPSTRNKKLEELAKTEAVTEQKEKASESAILEQLRTL